ncbi:acetylserotonin O-methyltransferase [Kogia breviceps]|uniref:acetylserotonin O-methyltransferase n=1 Tax=Kogia breviceps TaxID=27615 RepID=UPI0034D200EE
MSSSSDSGPQAQGLPLYLRDSAQGAPCPCPRRPLRILTGVLSHAGSEGETLQAVRGLQDEWRLGGPRVVAAFDLSPFPLICDLGGGSGALAEACMSLYPGSQVTVSDILDVVQTAKRHFSFLEDERIGLCEDSPPEPGLCILARVLRDWTGDKCPQLPARAYQARKTRMW